MLQADPYQLRYLAHQFSAAADEIRNQAGRIEGISSDVTGGSAGWKGEAAKGFVQRSEFLADQVRDAVKDFHTIVDALQTLAYRLEQIQAKQQHLHHFQQQRSHLHVGVNLGKMLRSQGWICKFSLWRGKLRQIACMQIWLRLLV